MTDINPVDTALNNTQQTTPKMDSTKNIPQDLDLIGVEPSTQDAQKIQKNQSAFSAINVGVLGLRLGVGALGAGLIAINLFNPATLVGITLTTVGILGAAGVAVLNSLATTGKVSLLEKPTVTSAVFTLPSSLTAITGIFFLLPIFIGGGAIRIACS